MTDLHPTRYPAHPRPSRRLPRLHRLLPVGLACLLALPLAHATPTATAWSGELEVLAHEGGACARQPALPYRIPVQAMRLAPDASGELGPRFLIWGGMQTMRLQGTPGTAGTQRLLAPVDGQAIGDAVEQGSGAALRWLWRETAAADGAGCSFTNARLQLRPASPTGNAHAIVETGHYLNAVYDAQRALLQAREREDAAAPLARLASLAREMPASRLGDSSLAELFTDSAYHAMALRHHADALALFQAATNLYRRHVEVDPDNAAIALANESRAVSRTRGRPQAIALLDEGLALLRQHQRQESAAAARLLGAKGALQLRQAQAPAAVQTYLQAMAINERRGAPSLELALSMANVAGAMSHAGMDEEAQQLYDRALRTLADSTGTAERELSEVIRQQRGPERKDMTG